MRLQLALLLLCTAPMAACASQTNLPAQLRDSIAARHADRIVELKQSQYYGDLYDENSRWLLSPYAFAETHHIVDTKGEPINPQGQRGIVPAGTIFRIEKVEFPDVKALAQRLLTTPRYNTWVHLVPTKDTASTVPRDRRSFIMLLPMDLDTEEAVEQEIAAQLAQSGTMQPWLDERRPTVRSAIMHKDIVEGMSLDELMAAMGPPQTWLNDRNDKGQHVQVAWYPSREAWLVNKQVATIKPARKATAMAPGVVRMQPPASTDSE